MEVILWRLYTTPAAHRRLVGLLEEIYTNLANPQVTIWEHFGKDFVTWQVFVTRPERAFLEKVLGASFGCRNYVNGRKTTPSGGSCRWLKHSK